MEAEKALIALGHRRRQQLFRLLLGHSCCVGALAQELGITQAAVSQHLKVLWEAGLLKREKRGYFTHYQADSEALSSLAEELSGWSRLSQAAQAPHGHCRCRGTCHSRKEGEE